MPVALALSETPPQTHRRHSPTTLPTLLTLLRYLFALGDEPARLVALLVDLDGPASESIAAMESWSASELGSVTMVGTNEHGLASLRPAP